MIQTHILYFINNRLLKIMKVLKTNYSNIFKITIDEMLMVTLLINYSKSSKSCELLVVFYLKFKYYHCALIEIQFGNPKSHLECNTLPRDSLLYTILPLIAITLLTNNCLMYRRRCEVCAICVLCPLTCAWTDVTDFIQIMPYFFVRKNVELFDNFHWIDFNVKWSSVLMMIVICYCSIQSIYLVSPVGPIQEGKKKWNGFGFLCLFSGLI